MTLKPIQSRAALTLLEVTLVVAVILGLITVLFIGANAYRKGTYRAQCLLNISNVQKAMRSYQNLYEKRTGDICSQERIAGAGKFIETIPSCPSGGNYTWPEMIPAVGTVYLTCSLASSDDHVPLSSNGW